MSILAAGWLFLINFRGISTKDNLKGKKINFNAKKNCEDKNLNKEGCRDGTYKFLNDIPMISCSMPLSQREAEYLSNYEYLKFSK